MCHADRTHIRTDLDLQHRLLATTRLAPSPSRHRLVVLDAQRSERSDRDGGGRQRSVQDAVHSDARRQERPTSLSHHRLTPFDAVHPTPPPESTHDLYRVQHWDRHQYRCCRCCLGTLLPLGRIMLRTGKWTRGHVYVTVRWTGFIPGAHLLNDSERRAQNPPSVDHI